MKKKKKTTVPTRNCDSRPGTPSTEKGSQNFTALVDSIRQVHEQYAALVNRTVNSTLTLRNWVIGGYIREYEQNGADRAQYGARMLEKLSDTLQSCLDRSYTGRYLGLCRQLFDVYPGIRKSVISEFLSPAYSASPQEDACNDILKSVISESRTPIPPMSMILSLTEQFSAGLDPAIPELATSDYGVSATKLVSVLSFTHLAELITLEDPLKRAFYEIECIRGNWSVRALKRQIATLYFERSGLSKDREKLATMVKKSIETAEPKLNIRDPYVFEFLGLRAAYAVSESDLEAALVEHLREFLLELGHGFCLEAQQKSILIGKTRGFVDLVFYHRILKCHVLVELKVDAFRREHLGHCAKGRRSRP